MKRGKLWVENVFFVRLEDVAEEDVVTDILMKDGSTGVAAILRSRWTKYIIYLIQSSKYFRLFRIIDIKVP